MFGLSQPEREALIENTDNIRNICIISHVDHGKTTMSDSLLGDGVISEKQVGYAKYLDSREDEQQRGITIEASAISIFYRNEQQLKRNAEQNCNYLINLIDSPGHIDFSSDVSTAVRLCDGGLLLVDVIEGVCIQTHAVIKQAYEEKVKLCLVLNKIDKLIVDLQMTPVEITEHLTRIIEQVNSLMSGFITSDAMNENDDDQNASSTTGAKQDLNIDEEFEQSLLFSPERGNVFFCSAIDKWGFRLVDFVPIIMERIGDSTSIQHKRSNLLKSLWGEYFWNNKTKKVVKKKKNIKVEQENIFTEFILNNIFEVYKCILLADRPKRLRKILQILSITIPESEFSKEKRTLLRAVMSSWLPLSKSAMSMVTRVVPSPRKAQDYKVDVLFNQMAPYKPKSNVIEKRAEIVSQNEAIYQSIKRCNSNRDAPLCIFVSKMVAVEKRLLSRDLQKLLIEQRNHQEEAGQEETEFIAYCRLFSGVLDATNMTNRKLYVIGPKFNPFRYDAENRTEIDASSLIPLMIMGSDFLPLNTVHAGTVFAIAGIGEHILKTGTISNFQYCQPFKKMTSQSAPILRVSIEPKNAKGLAEALQWLAPAESIGSSCRNQGSKQRGAHSFAPSGSSIWSGA